jgi:hypothetical protein
MWGWIFPGWGGVLAIFLKKGGFLGFFGVFGFSWVGGGVSSSIFPGWGGGWGGGFLVGRGYLVCLEKPPPATLRRPLVVYIPPLFRAPKFASKTSQVGGVY